MGRAAAAIGEWMEWLVDNARRYGADEVAPNAETNAFTAPPNTRANYTTTYSRTTTPRGEEPTLDLEELSWHQFQIVTEEQSETSYGAIEEAMYAVNGDELVLADLDGRIFSTSQFVPGDDPATIARRILRRRVDRRPKPLVFPNMGIA